MWLAASTLVLVNNYDAVDKLIVETTTGIQNGFEDPGSDDVQQHVLPNELHTRVVYENWLRCEFGKPDDPKALEFGRPLLAAQAWTRDDLVSGNDANDKAESDKRADYQKIYNELGAAQGYFAGTEGSRTGAGFLGFFQAIVYSFFQFPAKLAVLLAPAVCLANFSSALGRKSRISGQIRRHCQFGAIAGWRNGPDEGMLVTAGNQSSAGGLRWARVGFS